MVALLLIVGVVFGAVFYVRSSLAKQASARPAQGFGNPLYDSTNANLAQQQTTAGYMDVPANQGTPMTSPMTSTGYMDVSPSDGHTASGYMDVAPGFDDGEEESV